MASQSQPNHSSLIQDTEEILGPGGRLARHWPEYEPRPGQVQMARHVAWAFDNHDIGLVEAGTGTGKTLAYIIPALRSGLKTIVSTGTKNLQEQIFNKDIPFIQNKLQSKFRAAYLKGRENYLCLHYYKIFLKEPAFAQVSETVYLEALKNWAKTTTTGDRAELDDFPEDFSTWSDLTASGERCLGRKCPEYADCFLQLARRNAAAADLVVVNHHLFMADLAIRDGGHGEVIPDYEAVVFDEAHQLESVATQHFGINVSTWRFIRLKNDVEKTLTRLKKMKPDLGRAIIAVGHLTDALAKGFIATPGEVELWPDNNPDLDRLREHGGKILAALNSLASLLKNEAKEKDDQEEMEKLVERAGAIVKDLEFILNATDAGFVYWAERRGKGLFLHASPIDVAPFMQEKLFKQGRPLIFTSATLSAGGSFSYFKERMGLLPEIEGVMVPSPFDYNKQTLLYVPRTFPDPRSPDYLPALADQVERLLELSQGRAFVLFTSYRNLNYVAQKLAPRLPWTIMIQGQAPKSTLLERFRTDTSSVLMATHSFWQGVDVPGESLSAVIIDKLPFPRPDRPLVRARSERLRQEGADAFMSYAVPEAIITLKQGLGRLVRARSDRGLLAVLDSRLVTKAYGRKFLGSLPGRRPTHNLDEVKSFFSDL